MTVSWKSIRMPPEIAISQVAWRDEHEALALVRHKVFIEEQGVPPSLEWDGSDDSAVHLAARDETGQVVGTARLLPSGQIGRMAVLPDFRRLGVGSALLRQVLQTARQQGHRQVFLNAQVAATALYARAGFEPRGPEFTEADIPHQRMERSL